MSSKAEAVKNLAFEWLEHLTELNRFAPRPTAASMYECPIYSITEIDGVRVSVTYSLSETNLYLSVDTPLSTEDEKPRNLVTYAFKKPDVETVSDEKLYHHGYTVTILSLMIINALNWMSKLRYLKSFGLTIYSTKMNAEREVFENSNTKMSGEVCCVCHDVTTNKTDCGHDLCLQCWTKLKSEIGCEFCDKCENKTCPICREPMSVTQIL